MNPNMNPNISSSRAGLLIPAAQIIELWGDGPIFPAPGWHLSWDIPTQAQQRLKASLLDGRLWEALQTNIPALSSIKNPWLASERHDESSELFVLEAVAAFAEALLQPAQLEIRKPYQTAKLTSACLVLQSDQHDLTGNALRVSAALILTEHLTQRSHGMNRGSLQQAVVALIQKAGICCKHALTTAQLAEARRRGIPTFIIDPTTRLYQFGTGTHNRWATSTSNDRDSAIGTAMARNKGKTRDLLRKLGFPVPKEIHLSHNAGDELILTAAKTIGYPCVLKPIDAEQGRGVTPNIRSDEELASAAKEAKKHTQSQLLLQQHINGDDYRLNTIGDKLAFVVKRSAPSITGNGHNTVQELIDGLNARRRVSQAQGQIAGEINPHDPEVIGLISKANLTFTSIPREGERVTLRRNANISTGGEREDIDPSRVHPVIQRQCLAIARTLGLEVCGIDYITTDITQSPELCEGAYIEVNSMPQNSAARASLLLDHLFPSGQTHSIPTTVIVGEWDTKGLAWIEKNLHDALTRNPDASIGVPFNLAAPLVALLDNHIKDKVHAYRHPIELLMNKANQHVIFILDPRQACNHGLPSATGSRSTSLILSDELKQDGAWLELLSRHGQTSDPPIS